MALGIGLGMSLVAAAAWAQPANDSFANAQMIAGPSGFLAPGTASNVGATLEPNEPAIQGNPGGKSVWYSWTAPATASITFNTYGSDFDTMLAAYTGNSVDALSLLQDNDNAGGGRQSSISFFATAGTTYYIKVDGYNAGDGASQGIINLNWGPGTGAPLLAGEFLFTSPSYMFSESEGFGPLNPFMLSVPARLTVTRTNGNAGKVIVNYSITNGLYTNLTRLFFIGTNTYMSNIAGAQVSFTNIFITNIVDLTQYQDYGYGRFIYHQVNNTTNIGITNVNGLISSFIVVSNDVGTNYDLSGCFNFGSTNTVVDTNATPNVTNITITLNFCTNYTITNIIPSAGFFVPFSDVVVFDDFQMSSNIYIFPPPFAPTPEVPPIPFSSDYFGPAVVINAYLVGVIDSVMLDPLESLAIAPPTATTELTNCIASFLSQEAYALTYPFSENDPHTVITGKLATNVFNFESATLRCTRNVNGQLVAHVGVLRSTLDASGSCTVNYRIDHLKAPPGDDANNIFPQFVDEVPLQAGSDYAFPNSTNAAAYGTEPDFDPVTGQLSWGAGDLQPKFIDVPIHDYPNKVEFNEDLLLELYFPGGPPGPPPTTSALGYVHTCVLTILFNNIVGEAEPAGAVDRAHNMDDSDGTQPPYNLHPGANGVVYAVAVQPNGSTVVAGDFSAYNTVPRNRLARMLPNGQIDLGFDPQDGADAFVTSLIVDAGGNILVGGAFSSINRVPRPRIARLNPDGSLDTTFFPGQGANNTIWSVSLHPTGNILVAGEFTTMNGIPRAYVARLTPNGALDTTFDPGAGPNGPVYAVAVQPDGRVVIGGDFTFVAGQVRNHVARLNTDGTLDTTFDPGFGADNTVYALYLQPDGKILVGGSFQNMNALFRSGIARLNPNGSEDESFDPGSGADDTVYNINVQRDGKILVAGIFSTFNQTRRVALARLFPWGSVDTSFMDTAYNQFAGLPHHYWDPNVEPRNFIFSTSLEANGNIVIGGGFARVGGGFARDDVRTRHNVARLIGGQTPGPGNIELAHPSYNSDQFSDLIFISLMRTNGNLGPAAATIGPDSVAPGPGVAVDSDDYTFSQSFWGQPTYIVSWPRPTWMLSDGTFGKNQGFSATIDPNTTVSYLLNDVYVSILDNTNVSGNRQFSMRLTHPTAADMFFLGGENIPLGVALGRTAAPVNIIDYHTLPGVLGFSSAGYIVDESTNAVITVTRTNGSAGLVTVKYTTLNGTATNGIHYTATSGQLTFLQGQTNQTFRINITDEAIKEGDHTVLLRLFNPSGGATLGLTNAVLTIIDNDIVGGYVEFTSATYGTNENSVYALVTVQRRGGASGLLTAQFTATNGTAVSGLNFIGVTNTLSWVDGDVQPKTIAIPLLNDGIVETAPLTINLQLSSATVNGQPAPLSLGTPNTATYYITNSDFPGQLSFSTPVYNINENGGPGYITVVRSGGSAGALAVNFATQAGSAVPGVDFVPTNGSFYFGPGEVSKTFSVPIIDNTAQDPPRFVTLSLSAAGTNILGSPTTAILNIIDDETFNQPPGQGDTTIDPSVGFNDNVLALFLQQDGKILAGGDFTIANGLIRERIARLNPDGTLDQAFSQTSTNAGANDSVLAIVSQTDRRVLVGGRFTTMNSVNRNFLARLNSDGSLDSTFNPGAGPDNSVYALAETFVGPDRKLLVGGAFANYNTLAFNYLVRLDNKGGVDPNFNAGSGPNGPVYAIVLQPDGKFLIGGDFTVVNGTSRGHIARLNADGSLDLSFDPGLGANDSVRAVAVQKDGRIVIGGLFNNVNGAQFNRVARLNANGSVDNTFNPGLGANDLVASIALQPDTRIVLGGQFTLCNGVTRGRVTRLNNDGTQDTMINFGLGANNFVAATLVQTNDEIVLGGGFTQYDDRAWGHIARIYGGTVAGSGRLEFGAPVYQVKEDATNVVISVRRRGGTSGAPLGNVSADVNTSNGSAIAGINYLPVSTNVVFPPGEVIKSFYLPVMRDYAITPALTVNLALSNLQPPGGPVIGDVPTATVLINNVDTGVTFSSPTYFIPEDALSGFAIISLVRSGSTNGVASVDFFTTTNGTAFAYTNYLPVTNTVLFAPGQVSNYVIVPVLHDPRAQGNTTVVMALTNANNTLLLNPSVATLTIIDVDRLPGIFVFSHTNYVVSEGGGQVAVTVVRTNGYSGAVSVNYTTVPGTALPGLKYVTTSNTLSFASGESSKSFTVPILEENQVEGNTTFYVQLSNPTGGSTLGPTNRVPVTIIDDDVGVALSSPIYIGTETDGSVTLTVNRVGTNSSTFVSYATSDGTAVAGSNYISSTGTLLFNAGETIKTFDIALLHDPRVTGPLSFNVDLFNASPGVQIFANNPATVTINDADPGFAFTNANFFTYKSGTNVLISVVRSNANTGLVSVNFNTSDGTAVAGVDYRPIAGTLTFSNGIALQSFSIPIVKNSLVEGDRTFFVNLVNPTPPAQLLQPSTAMITITDDVSGLTFSGPSYRVNENGVGATITVLRTGYTNSTVSVNYSTVDGTGRAGVNYQPVNGTFIFTNGQTAQTFFVPVIDDGVLNGDQTVLLRLDNVVGNAVLTTNSAATLTVVETDGSLVVPAGTALISESGLPPNGYIDPGETVSLQFAFRNSAGTNTANLVATLLATNGVTPLSGPQPYGVLAVRGPSVSRPFTFQANATNGQSISATFKLTDGNGPTNFARVNFLVGKTTVVYSNQAPIVINDATNASPYPSVINVSGAPGAVSSVTVTITNLNHTWPRDIDALLVSPAGQNSYLMAKAGSSFTINNVTLTFDDSAPSFLPQSSMLTSGTYKPTSYAAVAPPFSSPAPPASAGAPYTTNLAAFAGSNPNGAWSLYVIDDTRFNSGIISNGWMLNLISTAPILGDADLGLAMTAAPDTVIATSNLVCVLTITNYGPASAANILVTDTFPPGAVFVSSSPSQGNAATNGAGQLNWTINSLPVNGYASLAILLRPAVPGVITNTAAVTSASSDLNPDDNIAAAAALVVAPTSDLAVGLMGSPNSLLLGNTVNYSIVVTNLGPATATAVSVSDLLPPGVVLVSATPPDYVLNGNSVSFPDLGDLVSGAQLTVSLQVKPTLAGTLTNTVSVTSGVTDPLKLNNFASVKTVVTALMLKVAASGGNLTFSWPADAANFYLEAAASIAPPVVWTRVTQPPPVLSGGQMTVTIPVGSGTGFYRLHSQTP